METANNSKNIEKQVAKNSIILSVMTLVSRITGLIRDFAITHIFGASSISDIFYMAFTIPNVMRRLVAEGTLTTVVQPSYQKVRLQQGEAAAHELLRKIYAFVLVLCFVITIIGVLFADPITRMFASGFYAEKLALTVTATKLMFPLVIAMGLVGLFMAILNANNEYISPTLAPIVLNFSIAIGAIVFSQFFEQQLYGLILGVLIGGLLQVIVQIPALVKRKLLVTPQFNFRDPEIKKVMAQFLPGLIGLSVYQINIIILRQLASHLPEGSVSYYYNADRIMELVNGVFAIAIAQGAFTAMNDCATNKDFDGLKRLWRNSFSLSNLVSVPAAIGLLLCAKPIISILFLHGKFTWDDVLKTSLTVQAASLGLIFTASIRGTLQIFYSLHDRMTPLYVSIAVVLTNLILGVFIVKNGYGIEALSFVLSIANMIQAILLIWLAKRKIGNLLDFKIMLDFAKKVTISFVACGIAYWIASFGHWQQGPKSIFNIVIFIAMISVAGMVYGSLAILLNIEGTTAVKRKILRSKK